MGQLDAEFTYIEKFLNVSQEMSINFSKRMVTRFFHGIKVYAFIQRFQLKYSLIVHGHIFKKH